jgi:hypothetical protein
MQFIAIQTLPSSATVALTLEREHEALCGFISTIGTLTFGRDALSELNRWMPLCWWSVYRLYDDRPPGLMHVSGSYGCADSTREAWQVYRSRLYQHDQTFNIARARVMQGALGLLHWHARELSGAHRAEIYSRHALRERVSIVLRDEDHGLLAVNFYRHELQDSFADDEIDAFRRMARPLMACVKRHVGLAGTPEMSALDRYELAPRERDVCVRLLKGTPFKVRQPEP